MKSFIQNLIWEAQRSLEKMKKDKMNLTDRILYEKALTQLEVAKSMLSKFEIN